MRKPNLFLVGAMKAGTTSVYSYLARSDQVYAPDIKEPNYYSFDLHRHRHRLMAHTIHAFSNHYFISSDAEYTSLYGDAPNNVPYILDASTTYLYSEVAAAAIAKDSPDSRIVILLRDPVRRAWSEYLMNRAIGVETRSFAAALQSEARALGKRGPLLYRRYIWAGRYADQIQRYLDHFPQGQVFIDVVDRPGAGLEPVLERIATFLGIPAPDAQNLPRENEARRTRFPLVNQLAYYTGVKALVSRMTPQGMKSAIKQGFYEPLQPGAELDLKAFAPLFGDSNRALRERFGLDIAHWN